MFITDNNLTIPNFLKSLGFLPPEGLTVEDVIIDQDSSPEVDENLNAMGFEAREIDPNYSNVIYHKKDFSQTYSFSDHDDYNSVDNVLTPFPRHIPMNVNEYNVALGNAPVEQLKLESPNDKVGFVEDFRNKCINMVLKEDNIFPKGTIFRFTEMVEEEKEVGLISKASMLAILFANDLKSMHWHAVGKQFDKVHDLCEQYYDEASDEADELAEMAIRCGEKIPNSSQIKDYIQTGANGQWEIYDKDTCTMDDFIVNLSEKGALFIKALSDIEAPNGGDQSTIDDFIKFWSVEVNYKNAARGYEPSESDAYEYEADYRNLLTDNDFGYASDEEASGLSDQTIDMFINSDEKANNYSFESSDLQPMTDDMIVTGGEEVSDDFDFEEE